MNPTKIEWVRNPDGSRGYSWNPIKGVCKGGCGYCYARKIYRRFKWDPRIRFDHNLVPSLIEKPSGFFVCSTHELFGDWIPVVWQVAILDNIRKLWARHRFYILTKQPQNIPYFDVSNNIWFGVTVNKGEDWPRLVILESIQASMKFISFEPLFDDVMENHRIYLDTFDWVIIGAQTNPFKRPKIEWVEHIISEADSCGIPVFLKNNLTPLMGEALRQEFPNSPSKERTT